MLCNRPIPHGTVASEYTEKNEKGEYVSGYVCYRCVNPYTGGPASRSNA